jgi:hypothetical protein
LAWQGAQEAVYAPLDRGRRLEVRPASYCLSSYACEKPQALRVPGGFPPGLGDSCHCWLELLIPDRTRAPAAALAGYAANQHRVNCVVRRDPNFAAKNHLSSSIAIASRFDGCILLASTSLVSRATDHSRLPFGSQSMACPGLAMPSVATRSRVEPASGSRST